MDVRPLHTEADYDWALAEIEVYFDHEPAFGSSEADRFDVLTTLISEYEDRNWPIDPPEPVAAIKHWMDIHGYRQNDLAALLGSRSRASELLNYKIPLNIVMARRLHEQWKMPAEILLQPAPDKLAA